MDTACRWSDPHKCLYFHHDVLFISAGSPPPHLRDHSPCSALTKTLLAHRNGKLTIDDVPTVCDDDSCFSAYSKLAHHLNKRRLKENGTLSYGKLVLSLYEVTSKPIPSPFRLALPAPHLVSPFHRWSAQNSGCRARTN